MINWEMFAGTATGCLLGTLASRILCKIGLGDLTPGRKSGGIKVSHGNIPPPYFPKTHYPIDDDFLLRKRPTPESVDRLR